MPIFYFWMSVVGLIAMWATWTYLVQDLTLDTYRAVLFECRADLLALVDAGEVHFDDPAYTSIREVINGLIRYGHKITFGFYIVAAIHAAKKRSDPDDTSVGQQIALHISRQNPHAKQRLIEIQERINRACLMFIFVRSVGLQIAFVIWMISKPFRESDTQRVKNEVVNQVQKDALRAARWEHSRPVLA